MISEVIFSLLKNPRNCDIVGSRKELLQMVPQQEDDVEEFGTIRKLTLFLIDRIEAISAHMDSPVIVRKKSVSGHPFERLMNSEGTGTPLSKPSCRICGKCFSREVMDSHTKDCVFGLPRTACIVLFYEILNSIRRCTSEWNSKENLAKFVRVLIHLVLLVDNAVCAHPNNLAYLIAEMCALEEKIETKAHSGPIRCSEVMPIVTQWVAAEKEDMDLDSNDIENVFFSFACVTPKEYQGGRAEITRQVLSDEDRKSDSWGKIWKRLARGMTWEEWVEHGDVVLRKFAILKPISCGAYGSVFLVKDVTTGELRAMKIMKKDDMIIRNKVKNVALEKMILSSISNTCPFVVKLYQAFQSNKNLHLVLEYVPGGDLFSLLQALTMLEEQDARFYVSEIATALNALHSVGVVHRDIKPDNVLIDSKGHVKLTDFGLARMSQHVERLTVKSPKPVPLLRRATSFVHARAAVSPNYPSRLHSNENHSDDSNESHYHHHHLFNNINNNKTSKDFPAANVEFFQQDNRLSLKIHDPISEHTSQASLQSKSGDCVGTPSYMAPESIDIKNGKIEDQLSYAVDWWSLGVVLYELVTGTLPFSGDTIAELFENIVTCDLQRPKHVHLTDDCWDLITKLLNPNPSERLTKFEEFKQHPFFYSINWENLYWEEVPFAPELQNEEDTSYFQSKLDPEHALELLDDGLRDSALHSTLFREFSFVLPSATKTLSASLPETHYFDQGMKKSCITLQLPETALKGTSSSTTQSYNNENENNNNNSNNNNHNSNNNNNNISNNNISNNNNNINNNINNNNNNINNNGNHQPPEGKDDLRHSSGNWSAFLDEPIPLMKTNVQYDYEHNTVNIDCDDTETETV